MGSRFSIAFILTELNGDTPSGITSEIVIRRADFSKFQWRSHYRELFQLPAAA
jgi:hypothetical protein